MNDDGNQKSVKMLIASWQEQNPISVPNKYGNPHRRQSQS